MCCASQPWHLNHINLDLSGCCCNSAICFAQYSPNAKLASHIIHNGLVDYGNRLCVLVVALRFLENWNFIISHSVVVRELVVNYYCVNSLIRESDWSGLMDSICSMRLQPLRFQTNILHQNLVFKKIMFNQKEKTVMTWYYLNMTAIRKVSVMTCLLPFESTQRVTAPSLVRNAQRWTLLLVKLVAEVAWVDRVASSLSLEMWLVY